MKSIEGYYYILDENRKPYSIDDPILWSKFIDNSENVRVACNEFPYGDTRVSTLFLGLDHSFNNSKPPILFETMVFSNHPKLNEYTERYSTWEEALEGHNRIINEGIEGINFKDNNLKKIILNLKKNKND